MNISCVICSDLFISADSVFTTPCGHIFHHACLVQWMERKKDCPQCRQKCNERSIFRVYFNNTTNLDSSSVNSANLIEQNDALSLKVRELEMALKTSNDQKTKLEENLQTKEKKIKKLDTTVSQSNQIISTMRHEIDVLSSHRAGYKQIESENKDLKSKMNLLQTIESVLTASQKEIDEILKQNLSAKDLAVMVGTLRRELNNTESRKNELRKQLQSVRNDLRMEQEDKKKIQDELSKLESENNLLLTKLKRSRTDENNDLDTPDNGKKSRQALLKLDNENTPSPLNQSEFKRRIETIQESDSPYFKVKKSSIALACVLKNPRLVTQAKSSSIPSDVTSKLSIFKKPRLTQDPFPRLNNLVYNGVGGTSKILQSDLKAQK